MSSNVYQVLLIENDSGLEHPARQMLSSEGPAFELIVAQSPEIALEIVASRGVDVILLHIPGAEAKSFENFIKFRALLTYSSPIVVLISAGNDTLGQQAISLGAADYLLKETLTGDLLRRVLRSVIGLERANAAARRVEQRFEDLFDNTTDILFTVDLAGRFTSLNKAAERVMGWPRREALQKNLKDLVAPEHQDLCNQIMERILRERSVPNFEVALLRNDGRRVFLETSVRVIESSGKKEAIQGIARDVTERRNLEHQLRQVQKLEAIGRLSGGLAHDFNNLLCVISGHTEILYERLQNTAAIRSVAQIKKATDSATALTRQLLAFSRKQVFHPRTMDLNAIVLETEKLLERLIGEHIEFFTALDTSLGQVHVDPVQIEQVLVNLVLNARDAMPQGGKLTIETRNVSLDENQESARSMIPSGKYALLAVTDTGCGMDEETQSRLFEPFYTTKELGKGTGLGLATVYGIVKQSGGFVWVYSELGRGTTFKIYLPRVGGIPALPAIAKQDITKCSGTETILLVEDAEPLRALTKGFLEDAGYKVLEASNGKQALQVAGSFDGPIHLLLTDVIMPGIGGKDLSDELTSLRPDLKVLFISGYPNDAITQSGTLVTGAILLEKPFSRELLWLKVRQVLSGSTTKAAGNQLIAPA
jgi:PAS domain S-box-containing protein